MNIKMTLIRTLACTVIAGFSLGAIAETPLEEALNNGAQKLSADEIAERLIGNTATWVSASGDKKLDVYYHEENALTGRLVGGDWTGGGYYGIANIDSLCVSWDPKDKGRLRCLDVLVVDGVVTKFNAADGSLNGHYEKIEDGKTF